MIGKLVRSSVVLGLAACLAAGATGCKSSSGSSVRTYDYDDTGAGRAHRDPPVETEREIDSGEWEMVAPGQPVVEPKR